MAAEKRYVKKSSAKAFGDYGAIRISFKVDELEVNEKGYVNLIVQPRKTVSEYGDTHSIMYNDWKPSGDRAPVAQTAPTGGGSNGDGGGPMPWEK
jgi:hypothetical protein